MAARRAALCDVAASNRLRQDAETRAAQAVFAADDALVQTGVACRRFSEFFLLLL
jgi:hypothetical protein